MIGLLDKLKMRGGCVGLEKNREEIARRNGDVFKNCPDGEVLPIKAMVHNGGIIELIPIDVSE